MGGTNSIQPRVARGVDDSVHLFWLDRASGSVMSRRSDDHGASFGVPQVVAPFHDDGRGNPLNTLTVGVDRSQGPRHGAIYVAWSEQMDGIFDPLTIVYEVEPNDAFSQATRVELGQEILGQMFRASKEFGSGDQDYLYFDELAGTTVQIESELTDVYLEPPYVLTMSLRLLCGENTASLRTILDLGLARAQDIPPVPRTVTLPRSGWFWLHSPGSSIYPHVYHIRLRELVARPGSASRDHRDIVLVHSMDGGATWSPKKRVNDCAPGDDDSLPELIVDDLGQIHVAWYCKRDEIDGCSTLTHTFWTVSSDGGATFRPALRASTSESPWDCPVDGLRIGRHLGLAAGGGRVHIAWTEVGCPDSVDIYTARIEDVATGIAVGRFEAAWRENAVRIAWQVADGRGIAGFRLHRARGDGAFEPIGDAIAYRGAIAYEQADEGASAGTTYRYRLEVLREDGPSTWEGPIVVTIPTIPRTLSWSAPIPNPFRETVTLELAVPVRSEVRVRIYDIQGHEVARLHEGALEPGTHRITWAGLNRRGRAAPPGVYLVRAEGGGETSVTRVMRIR
jgi:hypothetical protein